METLTKELAAYEGLKTYIAPPCCEFSQGIVSNPRIENLHITNNIVAVGVSFKLKSLKITISDHSKFNLEAFKTSSVEKLIVEIIEASRQLSGFSVRSFQEGLPFKEDLQNLASKVTEIDFAFPNLASHLANGLK